MKRMPRLLTAALAIASLFSAASSAVAQVSTGTYTFEDNNGTTGTVVVTHVSGNIYTVQYTPTGGSSETQTMVKQANGDLRPALPGGKFGLIQGQNSGTPPEEKHGTVDSQGVTGSITKNP